MNERIRMLVAFAARCSTIAVAWTGLLVPAGPVVGQQQAQTLPAPIAPAQPTAPSQPQIPQQPPAQPELSSTLPAAPPGVEFKHRADEFIAAFDAADPSKLLTLFATDSEYVDQAGILYLGKEEIKELLSGFFAIYPGAKLTIDVDSVRQLGESSIVIEEGHRTIAVPGENAWTASYQYIVVYAFIKGQWLIASIREFPDSTLATPHDQLQPLAWLVGNWVNEGSDASVKIDFAWSDDGNYLIGNYQTMREGEVVRTATHRIGWNPMLGQFQSWIFDSDGGFGSGLWASSEDGWLIKSDSVLADGSGSSATLKWSVESADRFKISGADRVIGPAVGEDFEVIVSRKPVVAVEPIGDAESKSSSAP